MQFRSTDFLRDGAAGLATVCFFLSAVVHAIANFDNQCLNMTEKSVGVLLVLANNHVTVKPSGNEEGVTTNNSSNAWGILTPTCDDSSVVTIPLKTAVPGSGNQTSWLDPLEGGQGVGPCIRNPSASIAEEHDCVRL